MPPLERAERLKVVKAELSGLDITGDLEPSDALIDKLSAQQEEGTLRYLKWSELSRRDLEVRSSRQETFWKADAGGTVKERERAVEISADTATDLKSKTALQRRGIAMRVAKLLPYKVHDKWVSKLFKELD